MLQTVASTMLIMVVNFHCFRTMKIVGYNVIELHTG